MWSPHQQGNCVAAGSIELLWVLFLVEACFLVLKDIPLVEYIVLDLLRLRDKDVPQS